MAYAISQLAVCDSKVIVIIVHDDGALEEKHDCIYQRNCRFSFGRKNDSRKPWNRSIETGWRLMFVSEAVPAGLFTLLVLFVPETPRYLAMTGRDEKALFVLSRINGLSQGKEILQEIKATAHEKTEKLFTYGWMVIFIGIMLSVFQQAVGIIHVQLGAYLLGAHRRDIP